jgi:predicted transcriptional regulator
MIRSSKKACKACLLGLSFSFAPIVSNAEIPVGSTPKTIVLQGEQGKLVDGGGPWKSDLFRGFVTILFYVDPDESDLNNAASEALKDANLPADQVRSVAVINMDATLLPNFLIQGKLEDKQKEYQNTLYVMDYKKVLVNEWGLGDHNNDVVIFDKQGKVLFSVDGQLNDSQIKQMLAAVKSGFN